SSFSHQIRPLHSSAPLPYTTLFRSGRGTAHRATTTNAVVGDARLLDLGRVVEVAAVEDGLCRQRVGQPRVVRAAEGFPFGDHGQDRKSTRLNSSHVKISYAVFCLKK